MSEEEMSSKTADYIQGILDTQGFDVNIEICDDQPGFSVTKIYGDQDKLSFRIDIEDKRLSWPTRLTLRHEVGHIVFDCLWKIDNRALWAIMFNINGRKWFCRLQKFYYWNPVLRKAKRMFGFSSKIDYGPDDTYKLWGDILTDRSWECTRMENELFCDWFAIYGWKKRVYR